jgi:hypothetical protein
VFDLGTMDACLYWYDHNQSGYRMNRFRIRVHAPEDCPIHLTSATPWLNFPEGISPGSSLALQRWNESLERTTMIINPWVYLTPTTEFIAR